MLTTQNSQLHPCPDRRLGRNVRQSLLQAAGAGDFAPWPSATAGRSVASAEWILWLAVALAIGPFVARRLILLGDVNYIHWLVVDNLARCISLVGVALGFRSGLLSDSHPRADWRTSYWIFLLLFAAENAEQMFGDPLWRHYLRFTQLSPWPPVLDPTLRILDLLAGLLLVALSEELVFRRFLFAVIERWFTGKVPVIMISATVFALVHFTSGVVDTMANALVHGIFLGIAFWATRRIAICVVSHYLIDLYVGIGP